MSLMLFKYSSPVGFSWHSTLLRLLATSTILVVIGLAAAKALPMVRGLAAGGILTACASLFCLPGLTSRIGDNHRLFLMARCLP